MSLVQNSDIHIDEAKPSGKYTKDVLFDKKSISKNIKQELKNGSSWMI